jgi:hypothetical protein
MPAVPPSVPPFHALYTANNGILLKRLSLNTSYRIKEFNFKNYRTSTAICYAAYRTSEPCDHYIIYRYAVN